MYGSWKVQREGSRMESGQLSEIRALEIKIEYYTLKALTDAKDAPVEEVLSTSLLLARLKVTKQLLVVLDYLDRLNNGELELSELSFLGGIASLRENVKMLKNMSDILSAEENKIKAGEDIDTGVIVKIGDYLKEQNKVLRKV